MTFQALQDSTNHGNKTKAAVIKYWGRHGVRSRYDLLGLINTVVNTHLTLSELNVALERGMPVKLLDNVAGTDKKKRWGNIQRLILNATTTDSNGLPEVKFKTFPLQNYTEAAIQALTLTMPVPVHPSAASTPTKAAPQAADTTTPDDDERKRKRSDDEEDEE